MAGKFSAGILVYRGHPGAIECFLAHPGGPFFAKKDEGHWTIPKGEVEPGEDVLSAALREFAEEIGWAPEGSTIPLGTIEQKGGKRVQAWAIAADWEGDRPIHSNQFVLQWPPHSGRRQEFPEVDRAQFFPLEIARRKIKPTQALFLDRLLSHLQSN